MEKFETLSNGHETHLIHKKSETHQGFIFLGAKPTSAA